MDPFKCTKCDSDMDFVKNFGIISMERYNSLDRTNYRNIADDDNRDKLLVMLAGYTDDMDRFLDINPGLKSRFANIIEFKDYSVDDLSTIADSLFKNKGYVISKEARLKMENIFEEASKVSDFGNGRYVRNIFEKTIRNQAVRLEKIDNLTKDHLITIEECDVSKVNL